MRGRWRLALTGTLAAAAMATAAPAPAAAWIVAPEESRVLFDYTRNGNATEGHFTRFVGEGDFDPANPGAATLEIRIESASIDLGSRVSSEFATSVEYFNSEAYPLVTYRLLRLTPDAGDRYRAEGELTIRGWTRTVESMVTLDIIGDTAHAAGTLTVLRKDYHFGVGPTSLFVDLGPEVAVRFDLTAHPLP